MLEFRDDVSLGFYAEKVFYNDEEVGLIFSTPSNLYGVMLGEKVYNRYFLTDSDAQQFVENTL